MENQFIFTVPAGEGHLIDDTTKIEARFEMPEAGLYRLELDYSAEGEKSAAFVYLNEQCMGLYTLTETAGERLSGAKLLFRKGENVLNLQGYYGSIRVTQITLTPAEAKTVNPTKRRPSNPNATPEACALMEYLTGIYGKKMLTGQHTKTVAQDELWHIKDVTGKLPAVCGFELLGYSPNVNYDESDEDTLTEVRENLDTIEKAIEWAEKYHGIVAYCWHWFSPMGGRNKAFYTEHTDFDLPRALEVGTPENTALLSDIDFMADKLKVFRERRIPILWRPLHEAEGGWFWWGAWGAEACKKLWKLMYTRFTELHGLDNLIWVWNSVSEDWYPGDDCVDIISTDFYAPAHNYGTLNCTFDLVDRLNTPECEKMICVAENGTVPDPEQAITSGACWLWYMTWCGEFCTSENWTSNEQLKAVYNSPYVLTLDDLPANFGI